MKNINENINRLRQIMSYDRSRGLLVNESQYSFEDNTEIDEQKIVKAVEDYEPQNLELAQSIAKQIYAASTGMGTDESRFLDAVKDIDSITTLMVVDNILKGTNYGDENEGFEFFVNDEFGMEDVDAVESIVRHLKSIGVKATYESSGPNFTGGTFKIETSLYPPKKGADDTPKDSDKYNDDGTPKEPNTEEPNTEEPNTEDKRCPTEEDILSGKVLLRKGAMDDVQCDVVVKIQKILIKKMGESGVTVSIGEKDYGYYGPKTVSLVFAYQSLKGLKEDGIVGKNTMKSILS